MPDGVELLADRWAPRAGGKSLPTALIRAPYGRRGIFGSTLARPLAERGFHSGEGPATGVAGADPEHAWHVRLGWGLRPDGL